MSKRLLFIAISLIAGVLLTLVSGAHATKKSYKADDKAVCAGVNVVDVVSIPPDQETDYGFPLTFHKNITAWCSANNGPSWSVAGSAGDVLIYGVATFLALEILRKYI